MAAPDWLTSRPIAHRGLHDLARGVVENSASAVAAAVAGRYGIEVDLQASADGEAMVHHDDALGRLTEGRANLAELSAAELKRVPFRATTDRMMTLGDLCDLVGGRVPLVLELKSRFDHPEWRALTAWQKRGLAHLLHAPWSRPDFVAYRVDDLPAPATRLAHGLGLPVLTWTVRTPAQRERAAQWADQMIFEGFRA